MVRKFGYLALALFILIADQISKWAVTEHIIRPAVDGFGESIGFFDWLFSAPERLPFVQIPVLPFFNFAMVWNQGVSFGMLSQNTSIGSWLLVGLSAVITIWFVIWLFAAFKPSPLPQSSAALWATPLTAHALARWLTFLIFTYLVIISRRLILPIAVLFWGYWP
jgi:lipoprotein signal peptidase